MDVFGIVPKGFSTRSSDHVGMPFVTGDWAARPVVGAIRVVGVAIFPKGAEVIALDALSVTEVIEGGDVHISYDAFHIDFRLDCVPIAREAAILPKIVLYRIGDEACLLQIRGIKSEGFA